MRQETKGQGKVKKQQHKKSNNRPAKTAEKNRQGHNENGRPGDGKAFGKFVVGLARKSIGQYLQAQNLLKFDENKIPFDELNEAKGCFVTLTIKGELRGCIGNIEPRGKLYEAIIRNAVYAAFNDTRFSPLSREEFKRIEVEVSVLTRPEPLEYRGASDLLEKINHEMGLIISKGHYSATFLPQVWEDIPNKEKFLSELCMKAGLLAGEWKGSSLKIEKYKVKAYCEKPQGKKIND